MIRKAALEDIPSLVGLENLCFDLDRISAKNFRHLLTKGNAETFVYELIENDNKIIAGYAALLFRKGSSLARLYSIAVHPARRGRKIGEALLSEAERTAISRECVYLRLEVRKDNLIPISLYKKFMYKQIGSIPGYYEDKTEALSFKKILCPNFGSGLK